MTWYAFDTWIVVVGALCAVACALPGCFLVLRRMSMMGDAISHAVLPGLAIAFLLTGSRASWTMFIGAVIIGVLTAVFTQWISHWGKVDRGASMGIVFTTLFAVGLILIVQAADHVDLDPECVLYGAIELTPLDVIWEGTWLGVFWEIPRAALVLLVVGLLNLILIVLFFKEFKLTSFDPDLATSLGIYAPFFHYLLMAMVAVTTVAAFEAVGSILVIAMLIVPGATAHLLCDRLAVMLWISAGVALLAAGSGHFLAVLIPAVTPLGDLSTSGMMAVMSGVIFTLAALFGPRHGWIARSWGRPRDKEEAQRDSFYSSESPRK